MARIQLSKKEERKIIKAIVEAGEVHFYGTKKLFTFGIKNSEKGKHLSKTKALSLFTKWTRKLDDKLKNKYRENHDL